VIHDLLGNVALTAHRINGHDGTLDRHHGEKLGDGDDFVRLVCHLNLSEHQALTRRKGRDHVDRQFRAFLLVGAAQRLAIDGDHFRRSAGQRRDPRHEAALELLNEHPPNLSH
jgi:hypothetical protein